MGFRNEKWTLPSLEGYNSEYRNQNYSSSESTWDYDAMMINSSFFFGGGGGREEGVYKSIFSIPCLDLLFLRSIPWCLCLFVYLSIFLFPLMETACFHLGEDLHYLPDSSPSKSLNYSAWNLSNLSVH